MRRNQTSNEKSNAVQPEKQAIKLAKQATKKAMQRNQKSSKKSNATQPKKQAKNARQRNQKTKQAIVLWLAYNNQKTNELEAVLIIVLT